MQILPSNRKETSVALTQDDPRCRAIVARYGDANQFYMSVADKQPKADTPTMVMARGAYGDEAITRQLMMRTRIMVVRMDESALNDEEVASIARAIAGDERGLMLSYDLVLGFFSAVERGEYELYAFKPRHIIAAWSQYVKAAHARMDRLKQKAESAKLEEERRKHDREYLRPDQFRRWKEEFLKSQNKCLK